MKPIALTIAAVSFFLGGAATFLVVRAISMDNPELSFVVSAVLGSQAGAIMHRRQPGAQPTIVAKAVLGAVLAICAVAFGFILHLAMHPFRFVEISVPFAAVGSFVFPFVLFDTMWNAMTNRDSESKPSDAWGVKNDSKRG